eukprot:1139625-Pelagomonas_calceolata.AAC.4
MHCHDFTAVWMKGPEPILTAVHRGMQVAAVCGCIIDWKEGTGTSQEGPRGTPFFNHFKTNRERRSVVIMSLTRWGAYSSIMVGSKFWDGLSLQKSGALSHQSRQTS